MQETKPPAGNNLQEFFKYDKGGMEKMDKRLEELKSQGHTLVKRRKIGRNAPCPCNSGEKFKKCCINKVR